MNQKDFFQGIDPKSIEGIKIKASIAREVINATLNFKKTQPAFSIDIKKVGELIRNKCVPCRFYEVEIPNTNERFLSFNFVCLLAVFQHEIDRLRTIGTYPKARKLNLISEQMLDKYPANKLLEALTLYTDGHFDADGNPLYAGKLFAYYFQLEGIKCHINSFVNWSNANPHLPRFYKAKYYTVEEFDMWRQFMLNKPGRKPPQYKCKQEVSPKVTLEIV